MIVLWDITKPSVHQLTGWFKGGRFLSLAFSFAQLSYNKGTMNIKRIFGSLLTILGIVGLIVAAVLFAGVGGDAGNYKLLATYGVLGLIFLISGIGLIRTTKDES